jgi:urea transporter/murein DD-endopeptidase MepM/ murein hydrolase activator NlpD
MNRDACGSLRAVFASYAEVFFLPGSAAGVVICAATFLHPNVGCAGVLSVLAAYGFARLVRMERQFLKSGYYTYNPLLVGLSLGHLFQFTPLTAFLVGAGGVLTFLVTVSAAQVFAGLGRLPILSVPFVVVSSIAYLATLRYSNLLVRAQWNAPWFTAEFGLPYWLAGFFKAFGAVLFTPSVVVGVVLALVTLCYSRVLLLLALGGYLVGAGVRSLMLGSAVRAFGDANNFNFIFIAMAVGGVFLLPSLGGYLLAAVAVTVATVCLDAITGFWSYYGIPAFTLPFNLVTLGFLHVLTLLRHPLVTAVAGRTPEERLGNHLADRLRYRGQEFTLHLPFAGRWTVWQGWNGRWTHQGSWRYAYDFVIAGEDGRTHRGDGTRLEDYHCFRKPVLSPARGRVVQVIDDLPDRPPGGADSSHNWGNLVILQDARGQFVELSHFAEKSIRVQVGQWVERGAPLGQCGNSGYSPQPHIHIQVQATDAVGAPSLPFSFVSFLEGNEYRANHLPAEGGAVEPLFRDKHLDNLTNFVLDETVEYRLLRPGRPEGRLLARVRMAVDGTFFLETARGCLYFGKHEGTFYFYRLDGDDPGLRILFLALPRLPLARRDRLTWSDHVPARWVAAGPAQAALGLLASVNPALATARVTLEFAGENQVATVIHSGPLHRRRTATVELDPVKGFAGVTLDDVTLRRVDAGVAA